MDYQIVAESAIHRGRRLLIGSDGAGYLQVDPGIPPVLLSDADFARLRSMHHYADLAPRAVTMPTCRVVREEYAGVTD
jgi:hypothetical protein